MQKLSTVPTAAELRLGLGYWGFQLLVLPSVFSLTVPILAPGLSEAHQNLIYFSLNFLCLCAIMHRFLLASLKSLPEQPWRLLAPALISLGSFWLFSFVFQWVFNQIHPDFSNVNDAAIAQMAQSNYILTAIGTVLLAPVAEELVFRGLIFGALHSRSRLAAYGVSCTVFALIHILGYLGQYSAVTLLLCFLQYLPAGACLGWAFEKSGSIFVPMAVHMAVNFITLQTLR